MIRKVRNRVYLVQLGKNFHKRFHVSYMRKYVDSRSTGHESKVTEMTSESSFTNVDDAACKCKAKMPTEEVSCEGETCIREKNTSKSHKRSVNSITTAVTGIRFKDCLVFFFFLALVCFGMLHVTNVQTCEAKHVFGKGFTISATESNDENFFRDVFFRDFPGQTDRAAQRAFPNTGTGEITKMISLQHPRTKMQVKALIDLFMYMPHYSTLVAPLTDLDEMKYPEKVHVSDACQEALELIRNTLSDNPAIMLSDVSKTKSDASKLAINAVFIQHDDVFYVDSKLLTKENNRLNRLMNENRLGRFE